MKTTNLKSKLNKMNINYTICSLSGDILFSLNGKNYEACVTVSDNICGYCTEVFTKFEGRSFETLNQVIRHANR